MINSMNSQARMLYNRIEERKAQIAVIGLGYVGLPLAVEKAKAGYKVVGLDILADRVALVNQGINYIGDVVDGELEDVIQSGMLTATTDYSVISESDCVMICVPTPLDKYLQPDISYVKESATEAAQYLRSGALVVLESTTYPGTTREIIQPILEKGGKICGQDFFLAFSPERVDPGNKIYQTKNTPKVVGGITEACTFISAALYRNVLEADVHVVSSPEVAEMEKILENTYRNINIALANEMAILCNRMGIDVWEVIDAAKTKPYGFQAFYPGPGVGGHCIPIDPFYLTWKAREFDYHTRLIETAGEINNYMPEFVVERAMRILNDFGKAMRGSKILLIGLAYKQDIDDLRESPALKVIEHLRCNGANVDYHDPFILNYKDGAAEMKSIPLIEETVSGYDLVIVTTSHTTIDYQRLVDMSCCVFDTKNATAHVRINREKIVKL